MNDKGKYRITESGAAEIIGALVLVSMIVLVVAVIATGLISRPLPDKVPQVRFSVGNSVGIAGQYSFNITHEGGDEIPFGEYAVFINDNNNDDTYSSKIGKYLTYVSIIPIFILSVSSK